MDRLYWRMKERGNYGSNLPPEDKLWKKIWNLKVPPKVKNFVWRAISNVLPTADLLRLKGVDIESRCSVCLQADETIYHCLFPCDFARRVWRASSFDFGPGGGDCFKDWVRLILDKMNQEEEEMAVMLCWALWRNRNEVVWNATLHMVARVLYSAKVFLQQWQAAQNPLDESRRPVTNQIHPHALRWERPLLLTKKINVDGALFPGQNRVGMGLILRDHNASFLGAKSIILEGNFLPMFVEAAAVREALLWISQQVLQDVVIEMDALLVFQALHRLKIDCSSFGLIIDYCRALTSSLSNIQFSYVRRSANQVAHRLARVTGSMSNSTEWLGNRSNFILDALNRDGLIE